MITVVDHASPWLILSSTLAKTIQPHDGAHMTSSGTGIATSQPARSTGLRPYRSPSRPATKLVAAFTTPKVATKESTAPRDASPNSASARRGSTVRSRPTMAPTKALTRTSSRNWCQFSRRPGAWPVAPCRSPFAGHGTGSVGGYRRRVIVRPRGGLPRPGSRPRRRPGRARATPEVAPEAGARARRRARPGRPLTARAARGRGCCGRIPARREFARSDDPS